MADVSLQNASLADQSDPSFATTLAHGLDLLAAFRNSSGALSNADLAAHTGLSRPTVSRLTYTLAQRFDIDEVKTEWHRDRNRAAGISREVAHQRSRHLPHF
jgi:hypothetical protein